MPHDMTGAEAKVEVAAQDKRRALKALQAERGKELRAKANHLRARERCDKAVALAVSSKPQRVDWYNHAGPIPQAEIREALKMSTMALHRLMERYRKSLERKGQRRRAK